MSKLFIYYSLSGNGDVVAEALKQKGYETTKVEPAKQPPKNIFLQMMRCGFNAGRQYCEPLKDYKADVTMFDGIVIGSPVWNGRLSCPINTVLQETDLKGKKVTFVLYSGSGEAQKAERQIRTAVPDAGIIHLQEPKKHTETLGRLSDL